MFKVRHSNAKALKLSQLHLKVSSNVQHSNAPSMLLHMFELIFQVCVEKCPNATWIWYKQYTLEKLNQAKKSDRSKSMFCKYGVDPNTSPKVWLNKGLFTIVNICLFMQNILKEVRGRRPTKYDHSYRTTIVSNQVTIHSAALIM